MNNIWQEYQMETPDIVIRTQIDYQNPQEILLHSHNFYEIIFCKSGNIQYFLKDKRFRLQHGDIVLIPPEVSHQPLFLEPLYEPYERYVLWIGKAFWENYMLQYPDLNFAFAQCLKRDSYLLRSSRATWSGLFIAASSILKEQEEKKLGWEFTVKYTALILMVHICRTYYYQDITIPPAEKETLIDDIFNYIDAHLSDKITLDKVAEHFLTSKSTISHLFQKQFHISFYQCVIQRRLIKAKNNILSGTPLKIVWEDCGFSDYSSFYRAFKKEFGISPKNFKQDRRIF